MCLCLVVYTIHFIFLQQVCVFSLWVNIISFLSIRLTTIFILRFEKHRRPVQAGRSWFSIYWREPKWQPNESVEYPSNVACTGVCGIKVNVKHLFVFGRILSLCSLIEHTINYTRIKRWIAPWSIIQKFLNISYLSIQLNFQSVVLYGSKKCDFDRKRDRHMVSTLR